jgi:asparaginyl-tRNA synthetase
MGIHEFLQSEGFILLDSPILTPAACEGTSTLFELQYFDFGKAYLSQSGQLYMEAGAAAFGKVYCLAPTFRAEKSKTRRHLTEFWMLEPEAAYYDWQDNMVLQEKLVSFIVNQALKKCQNELEILERDTTPLQKIQPPFPRISYTEAIEILKKKGSPAQWGDDFGGDEETLISKTSIDRFLFIIIQHNQSFLYATDPENPTMVLT